MNAAATTAQVRFGFQLHTDDGPCTGIGKAIVSDEVDEIGRRTLAATFAREIELALAPAVAGETDYDSAIADLCARLQTLPVDGVTLEGFVRIKLQNADGAVLYERGSRSSTEADYPEHP